MNAHQNTSERQRVLVVDDEKLVGTLLARFLRKDFDVTVIVDGEEALERLGTETFDLVVTDLKMPGVSGEDIIAKARSLEQKPPVVVMSGHASTDGTMEKVMGAGAAGFLEKPFPGKARVLAYLKEILAQD